MLPSGIANVANQKRTVAVEDLLVFAAALNASPADFLAAPDGDQIAIAPKLEPVSSAVLRSWFAGEAPLVIPEGTSWDEARTEFLEAAPKSFRDSENLKHQTFQHPAVAALSELDAFTRGAVLKDDGIAPEQMAEALRDSLKKVTAYVNLLADEVDRRANDDQG